MSIAVPNLVKKTKSKLKKITLIYKAGSFDMYNCRNQRKKGKTDIDTSLLLIKMYTYQDNEKPTHHHADNDVEKR